MSGRIAYECEIARTHRPLEDIEMPRLGAKRILGATLVAGCVPMNGRFLFVWIILSGAFLIETEAVFAATLEEAGRTNWFLKDNSLFKACNVTLADCKTPTRLSKVEYYSRRYILVVFLQKANIWLVGCVQIKTNASFQMGRGERSRWCHLKYYRLTSISRIRESTIFSYSAWE